MTKTPGQVDFEARDAYALRWEELGFSDKEDNEKGAAAVIAHVRPQIEREALLNYKGSKCAATVPSFEPMDCNAPFCGCDPVMAHTIDDLINCGWKSAEEVKQIEAEARAAMAEQIIDLDLANVISRDVAEIPYRDSPEDQPEMMLVTQLELRDIVERHIELIGELAALPSTHQVVPVSVAKFAAWLIRESRESMRGFAGGELQDRMVSDGVLVECAAIEPCGEDCACAELGFPAYCYRLTDEVKAMLAASKGDA